MYRTAFETLAGRNYDVNKLRSEIQKGAVMDEPFFLTAPNSDRNVRTVLGIRPSDDQTPAFTHPLDVELGSGNDKITFIFIDTRPYTKESRAGEIQFTNTGEYNFQLLRGLLNHHWIEESPQDLFNLGELAPLTFVRWLTNAISKRLGLDPADQVKVSVVTYFYWYCLFQKEDECDLDERTRQRLVAKLSRMTNIPSNVAFEVVDEIQEMYGLEDYVMVLKNAIPNPRLEKLSPAFIFAMLGGSWFGTNVKETIAVATEHPPTFLAIVAHAASSRAYRKTVIGSLVEDLDRKDRGKQFTKAVSGVIAQQFS